MLSALSTKLNDIKREFRDLSNLLETENEGLHTLIFYSERDNYFRYFEGYIKYILANSDLTICYITSDPDDTIFQHASKRIHPFYINRFLKAAFARLRAKVLVMTAPELNHGAIKRIEPNCHHIYAFHAISSIHRGYTAGALDHYDTILCTGAHQFEEIRRLETLNNSKKKNLVLTGYPLADKLWKEHQNYGRDTSTQAPPLILIAPTWGNCSILETCAEELLQTLSSTPYRVILRPHSEFMKRSPAQYKHLKKLAEYTNNITFQENISSFDILHETDLLITEHSSIMWEYAFVAERPVLFIDTPAGRLGNPEWEKVGLPAIELEFRPQLGKIIAPAALSSLPVWIEELLNSRAAFQANISQLRSQILANWLNSAKIGGETIINLCKQPAVSNKMESSALRHGGG